MELGDLDLQGIEESCKKKIPIPKPQLEHFKKIVIKARNDTNKLNKGEAKNVNLGVKPNSKKELKTPYQEDKKRDRRTNRQHPNKVANMMRDSCQYNKLMDLFSSLCQSLKGKLYLGKSEV